MRPATGRRDLLCSEQVDHLPERTLLCHILTEDRLHHGGFRRVSPDPGRVTRPLRAGAIAIGWDGPRQQGPCPHFRLPPAPHPFCNQRPFILRDRTPDLQQEMIVRIPTHRVVEKFHLAPPLLQLLQEEHLMDIVARQPVGGRDADTIKCCCSRRVAQGL